MFFRRKKTPADAGEGDAGLAGMLEAEGASVPAAQPPTTQFLTGDQGTDRHTVQVLLDTIARVSESRDIESLLVDIVDRSVELTRAERGLLLLANGEGELVVRVARSDRPDPATGSRSLSGDLRFSTSIAGRVLQEDQAVRATVHSDSEALELGRSVYDLKLRAVMCVPLRATAGGEGLSGVLYVDSRAATRQFSQRDLGLFAALAQHISIALVNAKLHLDSLEKVRLEQSLELASAIQRDLMPSVPKGLAGYDLHGWYRPAEKAAGDFYDFLKTRDGRTVAVVGDATGHGIGPALITASAQAGLRSYLRLLSDCAQAMTLLNQDLCERIQDGRFLTMFAAGLAPGGRVEAVNAGHEPALLWRAASGTVEPVGGRGGPALGMVPDFAYSAAAPMVLASGDALLLFSDGLSELRHPSAERLLGVDGLRESLARRAPAAGGAKDLALGLVEDALEFAGGAHGDDVTALVVRKL